METKEKDRNVLSRMKAAAAILWGALIVIAFFNRDKVTVESLSGLGRSGMLPAAGIMLVLFALKSISVFLYCGILYAACGVLFPLPVALTVSMAGSFVICVVPYALGRLLNENGVQQLLEKYPKLAKVLDVRENNDFLLSLTVRACGFIPSDPFSILMGALGADPGQYLLGSLIGFIPDTLAYTIIGQNIHDPSSPCFLALMATKAAAIVLWVGYSRKKKKEKLES